MRDIEKLIKAYQIAGKIVKEFGDPYLPLFKRLHDDCKMFQELDALKKIAQKSHCS